ncbi:lethal giant larvae like, C-terminal-domain-containing protein [Ephemerocybe angulata]|uniref:Lethal giant larvae like, C-terminal-domain-containing protein n=1 Tax=Ephemerocybe angulata TaxID=980116 RepID=A0A8H6IL70_9AGAR|nr:lethal giant larvae like, C-terminal-domain-containing protein [Tulosesus angulatus]
MFAKHQHPEFLELSNDLQDESDWVIGCLRTFDVPLNITAFAVEPVSKLLAIGTSSGSIYIHGGPGVDVKVNTPVSVGVKFLAFCLPAKKMVCLDVNNQLHVWDLSTFGNPEYRASARYDPVNSIHIPSSSCHVFLALQSGEVKTYDLVCRRRSQYTIPNLWKLYQKSMRASGVPAMVEQSSAFDPCIDQVIHPRDMNQIFLAYAGGVILSNITDRSTVRAFELILPPGAPGGSSYGAEDILTHRQPFVTCISVHPSGHFFAVGHVDGSIAFWAVEDDSAPLTVFTFDEDNVHLVNSAKLEEQLESHGRGTQPVSIREPIFKLAWSGYPNSTDPRGGETTLTVLGGLDAIRGGNVTVLWFPAFQPTEPPAGDKLEPGVLHPFFRNAMVDSVTPIDLAEYDLEGEIQDFLLIPKEHPHYAGTFNPYSIVFLVANKDNDRVTRAYSFPPSRTITLGKKDNPAEATTKSPLSPEFEDPQSVFPYHEHGLPFQLTAGGLGLTNGRLVTVDNTPYERIGIVGKTASPGDSVVLLEGGKAFADQIKHDEIRLTKYQPRRLMITQTRDLRVLFFDVSAQLLVGNDQEPLEGRFPGPLPGLSVELHSVWNELVARGKRSGSGPRAIQAVHLASEALEVASVLDTGDVVVHRRESRASSSTGMQSSDITLLHSAPTDINSNMVPYFALEGEGTVEACSISDVGFLAVSYSNGSVAIVDMRGPSVIHQSSPSKKDKHISLNNLHIHNSVDVANALTWTISCLENDIALRVRLLISRHSGSLEVLTLVPSGTPATWGVEKEPTIIRGVSEPLPEGSFVLDSKSGSQRGATGSLFASALDHQSSSSPSLLVTVGAKGARAYANITGERIGKADWGVRAGNALAAQVVKRMASRALVVVTDKEETLAYSLPWLELITRFPVLPLERGLISIDDSGDFLSFSPSITSGTIGRVSYNTFFDIRRAYGLPDVNFGLQPCKEAQPQPVYMGPPSLVGTWLTFSQTMTGEQLDNLLGGPDRPLPQAQPRPGLAPAGGSYGSGIAGSASSAAATIAASAASAQTSFYNKISSALSERGQMLGGLEESFNSLEEGSRNMAAQAKRLAAQQTAKSWFGF